jgi:hypothetical protein
MANELSYTESVFTNNSSGSLNKSQLYLKRVGRHGQRGHQGKLSRAPLLHKSLWPRSLTPRIGDSGESFFEYEYIREFEAKIGTARKIV